MSELYHVVVLRRTTPAQVQLNYISKGNATEAFERLRHGLTGRETFEDSYGSRISFDPEDIGHVMFLDAGRVLDMRATSALMEARSQANANSQAARDPVLARRNGLLVPAGPGVPQN